MPTTTGAAALPSPLAAEAPDGPGAFLSLAQRVAASVDPVANVAALPAAGLFPGQRLPVLSTPGAVWEWDGADWNMTGIAEFSSTGARDAAIVSPAAGMLVLVAGVTFYRYSGSAWIPFATRQQRAVLQRTGALNLGSAAVEVPITWPTQLYISEGFSHSTTVSSERITAAESGVYRVVASVTWSANATGTRRIGYTVNGGARTDLAFDTTPTGAAPYYQSVCSGGFALTAGQYVTIAVLQTSGAALTITGEATLERLDV